MYASFGDERNHDHDFASYAIWVEGLIPVFAQLQTDGVITQEVAASFDFQGTTLTPDANDAQCQVYTPDAARACHGTGQFNLSGDAYTVLFHKGEVVKVVKDASSGTREAYTCRQQCSEKHGPYSLISGAANKLN